MANLIGKMMSHGVWEHGILSFYQTRPHAEKDRNGGFSSGV